MTVSTADRIKTWARAGGVCSFSGCKIELSTQEFLVGEIAHIIARRSLGPRGSEYIPPEERDQYENLILLCPTHHALVDKSRGAYSSSTLRAMKREHENWVRHCLNIGEPWTTSMADIYYLNAPRLGLHAALNGIAFPILDLPGEKALHSLGYQVASVLEKFSEILRRLEIRAVRLDHDLALTAIEEGGIISFDGHFRVRNFRAVPGDQATFRLKGNPAKDPFICQESASFSFKCFLDPKWATTATAFGFFRHSQRMAGLAIVRRVDPTSGTLEGTPLVIGIPKPAWLEEAEDLGKLIEGHLTPQLKRTRHGAD